MKHHKITSLLRPYLTRFGADTLDICWRNVCNGLQYAADGTQYIEVKLANLTTNRAIPMIITRDGAIYTKHYGRKERRIFEQMTADGLIEWDMDERVFEETKIKLW